MTSNLKSRANQLIASFNSNDEITSKITIGSSFGNKTEVNIDNTMVTEFYSDALNLIAQSNALYYSSGGDQDDTSFGLQFCEKVNDLVPAMVNMTFQFPDQEALSFYDADFIIQITRIIQNIIRDTFVIDGRDPKELICVVLESGIWHKGGKQFQKLRFHFPYLGVSRNVLNSWIIEQVILDLTFHDLIKGLRVTPSISDWNQIISKVGSFVPMYGSKETEDSLPVLMRCVFSSILDFDVFGVRIENEADQEYYIPYDDDIIDPMDSSLVKQQIVDYDQFLERDKEENLPMLLSVHFPANFTKIIPGAIVFTDSKKPTKVSKETGWTTEVDNVQDIYNDLISIISPERCSPERKYDWYAIGRVTHNIFNGTKMGLEKFIEISHEDLKEECHSLWETLANEYLDIRTLMSFAQEDNRERFQEWHKGYYEPFIEPAMRGKNMSVADLASRVILDFVYDRENRIWYRLKRSHLVKDIGECELKEVLRTKLKNIMYEIRKNREAERDKAETNERKKLYNTMVREVDLLIDKLDDVDYLEKVIKALRSKMFDDNLPRLCDENLDLIACTNVVLECYDRDICYRTGRIQDYITKSTDIAFPIGYSKDNKNVKFLIKYYGQIHCESKMYYKEADHSKYCKSIFCQDSNNKNVNGICGELCHGEMCHFVLKDNASFLKGGNDEKRFRNWIGPPNGAKSQKKKLFEAALGQYCVDFPNDSITINKFKSNGGPDPALDQAKGSRMAMVSESDKSEVMHPGKIKKYTGGDRFWTRTLNKEGGSRKLSFKLCLMSNTEPKPQDPDEAYDFREILYPHDSKWVSNPPDDEIEQYRRKRFKMDPQFYKKIPSLGQAQLWLMYHYYPIYMREGLNDIPECVKTMTEDHQKDNNPYYNFIKEKIEVNYIEGEEDTKIIDESKSLTLYEAFQQYKRWYPTFSPDTMMNINQAAFKKEMIADGRLGPLNEYNEWVGLSFRSSRSQRQQ